MNLDSIDMSGLNDVISSLSENDIEALKGMAQSFFGKEEKNGNDSKEKKQTQNQQPIFDIESLSKIASMMSLLQSEQNDPRCELLYALRPMLKKQRQIKVDQAVQIINLFSIIPKIKELDL